MSHHTPYLFFATQCYVYVQRAHSAPCYSYHNPSPSPTPHSDLSTHTALLDVVIGALSSPTEKIRAATSYALGSVSAGNLQLYLPVILQEIEAKPRRQYLLLHSLKEVREGRVGVGGVKEEEGERERGELVRCDPRNSMR